MTTFKPLRDFILVEPIKPALKQGGIIVASEEQLKPTKGKVLAVGPGLYEKGVLVEVPVKVGDIITWPKGSVMTFKVDGKDFSVVPASQLIGVER
jgi:chaperonin GroES